MDLNFTRLQRPFEFDLLQLRFRTHAQRARLLSFSCLLSALPFRLTCAIHRRDTATCIMKRGFGFSVQRATVSLVCLPNV
jgi:hypothetical protein